MHFYPNNTDFVILGAGNVAAHMATAIQDEGYAIRQIYSRTVQSAKQLAAKLSVDFTTNLDELDTEADIYLFMLSDEALAQVLEKTKLFGKLIVHTSGSIPMEIFKKYSDQYGVVYPLQTFSKEIPVNFKSVPLFIEASDDKVSEILNNIAGQLSNNVSKANSDERMYLHIAAVFACNFTNHMYTIANGLLNTKNIDFRVLEPLINQTVKKALNQGPAHVQTGPALRNDKIIINKHKKLLSFNDDLRKIYSFVSEHIYNYYNEQNYKF